MGLVGRYIDALSDEQRDNVIVAAEFGYGQRVDAYGRGCLVQVAEQGASDVCLRFKFQYPQRGVGGQFDALCKRFGKARIVAACKARAARGNRIHEMRAEIYEELTPREVMAWREGKARRLVPDGGMYGSTLITSGGTDA